MPAGGGGAYSGTHRGEGPLGFSERHFNVVAHLMSPDTGGTRAMQGVAARSTEELVAEIERRLEHGFRVVDADVYNEFADAYQPLRAADFPHLPSNIELSLKVVRAAAGRNADDWTAGDGGMTFDQRRRSRFGAAPDAGPRGAAAGRSGLSGGNDEGPDLRRQIVDRTRALFLPYFNRHQITKAEMASACAEILSRFGIDRGLNEEQMAATTRNVTLAETDMLRRLCYEFTMESGFDKRQPGHHHAAADVSHRRGQQLGYGFDDFSAGVGPSVRNIGGNGGEMGRRTPTAGARKASPNASARRPAFGSTASRFAGDAGRNSPTRGRVQTSSVRHQRHHHRLDRGAWQEDESPFRNERSNPFYDRPGGHYRDSPDDQRYHQRAALGPYAYNPHGASPERGGVGSVPLPSPRPGNANDDSTANITAVSYTVAGQFPREPPAAPADSSAAPGELRAVLSPPAIAAADDDVVITAAIHAASPTSLCWWLAYGPNAIVLNLDKLYSNGMVTTFQVSENAVVLTVRGGTLVPGWEYAVHLDVTEAATGRLASAQTRFKVPGTGAPGGANHQQHQHSGGAAGPAALAPPGIGSATNLDARRAEYIRDKRSATNAWFGGGYQADGERGQIRGAEATRAQVQVASPPGTVKSVQKVTTESIGVGGGAPSPSGSPTSATPQRQVMPRGDGGGGGADGASTKPASSKGTFQEQLRDFFVQQIEPLYYLSSNPSLSEHAFRAAIQRVSKEYWFSRPSEAMLGEDTKREIVKDVKLAVARAREESGKGGM